MRDVNNGWLIRYTHANVASFFFIFVYMHIGRGLYYSSYKSPRVLVWSIGVIILILMMAMLWPNWKYYDFYTMQNHTHVSMAGLSSAVLPFNKARTKAINRIGPHNKEILDIIISGMLGDFWADKIQGKLSHSVRFNLEQSISNTAYIHYLNLLFYKLGYCSRPVPTLIVKSPATVTGLPLTKVMTFTPNAVSPFPPLRVGEKSEAKEEKSTSPSILSPSPTKANGIALPKVLVGGDSKHIKGAKVQRSEIDIEKRYNYKLSLFTFSSLTWIYDSFYINVKGKTIKTVPVFISDSLTPIGLAHWIMLEGSYQKGQGIFIATNSFTYDECLFLASILNKKYKFKTSVIKSGHTNQWRISI